ncbi:MAG: nucleotidyl transferase AbiEii/AbiGii toxin family protein, partial [Polyangiaceae bacterium]
MSPREANELFHLLFLRVLTSSADRAHYRVKGGCNLRFWFKSVRYSEDLDLDVVITSRATLRNKIDRILEAGPLVAMLRTRGLAIEAWSAPKQTDTTQRWKVSLRSDDSRTAIHTKIEFSRRQPAGVH